MLVLVNKDASIPVDTDNLAPTLAHNAKAQRSGCWQQEHRAIFDVFIQPVTMISDQGWFLQNGIQHGYIQSHGHWIQDNSSIIVVFIMILSWLLTFGSMHLSWFDTWWASLGWQWLSSTRFNHWRSSIDLRRSISIHQRIHPMILCCTLVHSYVIAVCNEWHLQHSLVSI